MTMQANIKQGGTMCFTFKDKTLINNKWVKTNCMFFIPPEYQHLINRDTESDALAGCIRLWINKYTGVTRRNLQ